MKRCSALWMLAWCATLLAASAAQAQDQPTVSVTVYNQGYAVIKDDRLVNIDATEATVRMREVAQHIDPTSVYFQSLTDPANTTVLEQNYEFDLVSADKLLQKYVDKNLTVWTKTGEKFAGTLQSFDAGQLVLKAGENIVMVQRADNVRDIEFQSLPEGLLTKPTLVWTVAAKKVGQHLVRLAYQTTQMDWRADYNVVTNEDDTRADIGGWVTLTNNSGATYKKAHLKLIAGDVRRVAEPVPLRSRAMMEAAKAAPMAAMPEEKPFFEYHMYTFERPTTLADRQVKQLQLLQAADVGLEKSYLYQGCDTPFYGNVQRDADWGETGNKKVKAILEIANTKANHLGQPLPAGKVRVFKKDKADNSLEFIGEDKIDHTKATDKVKLYVGNAFDLNGERKKMDFQRDEGRRMMTEKIQITLTSAKDQPVKIKVEEKLSRAKSWQILEKSDDFTKEDAHTISFVVPVEAKKGDDPGKKVITYTVQYTW